MLRFILGLIVISIASMAIANDEVEAGTCSPPSLIPPFNTCDTSDSVSVTATVADSTVTFTGLAPASSTVTFKDNGSPAGTVVTNPSGVFSKVIISTPGLHDFAVYLTDTSGRTTPETVFSGVNLPFHADTPISNILLPPTIETSKTTLSQGESIAVFGQASPGSTLHLILNGTQVYSSVIGSGSDYNVVLTNQYVAGANSVYAYLTRNGYSNSINSFTKNFTVGSCRRSDLNCDGHVNLTDFSILMYWWGTSGPTGDINLDGKVGLVDFSIMLFDWTD